MGFSGLLLSLLSREDLTEAEQAQLAELAAEPATVQDRVQDGQ